MRFFLRDAAKLDLADIWLSTANRWGVDQADDYLRAIEDRLSRICDSPESYPSYDCPHGTFRKTRSGEHLIFYIVNETMAEVVRVLHSRMDLEEALK